MKKAFVFSGGGCLGAWGGGVIEGLTSKGKDYDLYVCTSTGSLLAPQASQKNFSLLKEAYTSVTQSSIFNVNPFTKSGGVNFFNAIWRVIRGKKTLGESLPLRKRINDFFPEKDFENLKSSNKEIVVTVVNMTTEKVEYKSSKNNYYSDFCDWIWASACAPVFMTLVEKNGFEYVDGGIIEHIPIQYAIENGATEIDVVIHRPIEKDIPIDNKMKNIFDHFMRIISVMHSELSADDIMISKLEAKNKDVILNLYYMPYKLSDNSLMFNGEEMSKWWELGKSAVTTESLHKKIVIKKIKNTKK